MKKRVIIFGVNYYPAKGGTSRVVENLILQLKDDFLITIYCYKNPLAKGHINGVNAVEIPRLFKGSLGSLFYFLFSALHILFFGKAEFIHAHKTDCALFIPLLRLRFKVLATSHEAPYKRDKWNKLQKFYFKICERLFIQSPTICTCISLPLTSYYKLKYHKDVIFIPNGINLSDKEDFDFPKAASFLPDTASLAKPYILFAARRLMSTKGCHTMLEALKQLNYQGQIFIAGELEPSAYLETLKNLAQGLNVYFLNLVEPLYALLALVSKAELFIFPSETEGMSVMLLEVASVGTPIIASDIPENTQIFSEQEVLYFKTADVTDLKQKINFGLNHLQQMQTLGTQAKTLVSEDYLWQNISKSYEKIYHSI